MKFKNIALSLIVISISSTALMQCGQDTINSNEEDVVYTIDNTQNDSNNEFNLNGEERESYKKKSIEELKKYTNLSVNDSFHFETFRFNEKTLGKNNTINEFFKERIEKMGHGLISVNWYNEEKSYIIIFNEDSKELDFIRIIGEANSASSEGFNEEELKELGEGFIKEVKLENIEFPECILVKKQGEYDMKGWHAYYKDKNDDNKKVVIEFDEKSGKITSFGFSSYADFLYEKEK